MNQYISFILLSIAMALLQSCSHKINRLGYVYPKDFKPEMCDVLVTTDSPSDQAKKLGTVRLEDTGFSTNCNEMDAIVILKKEACAAGGNWVNITEERRSDLRSTCYRCSADIYLVSRDSTIKQTYKDNLNQNSQLIERVKEDKKQNKTMFWTSFAVGFFVSFLIAL